MSPVFVATFYRFVRLPDYRELREPLRALCRQHDLRGTILLAAEGINGTLAGSRDGVEAVLRHLRSDPRLAALEHKASQADAMPFHRMKVKLRKEIVTMGVPETDPEALVGTYLDARAWNELIVDPEVLVVDTRNQYEVDIGTFTNATSPNTESFREFPDYAEQQLAQHKNRKVALFCTGGIRCEKATSYLKANGFEQVFHLQGGILKYLETVPPEDNLWQGECFVFDARVAVDKSLQPGHYESCHACGRPVSAQDKSSPDYEAGVSCPRCIDAYTPEQRARFAEREKQVRLAEARGEQHIGVPQSGDARARNADVRHAGGPQPGDGAAPHDDEPH